MPKYMPLPNFVWQIENYDTCSDKKLSPIVFVGDLKFQCSFSKWIDESCEKLSLFLECLNVSEALLNWEFRVESSVVGPEGYHYGNMKSTATFTLKHKKWCIWSDTLAHFVFCYGAGNITFFVAIIPLGSLESIFQKQGSDKGVSKESLCVKSLSEDFGKMFDNKEHSDFVFRCDNKMFYLHKSVLSIRSNYFAAMFRSDWKEAKEGTAHIEGIKPSILELVLRYLYTGKLPELSMKSLRKVHAVAERFLVEPLKAKCHSLLLDHIIADSEKNSDKETANVNERMDVNEQAVGQTKSDEANEKELLKELFLTREWRSFSEAFPRKAQEMCKPFFVQK